MSYPLLFFVDSQGKRLPEEDGCQHYRQYDKDFSMTESCFVEIEGDWNSGVGLLREREIVPLQISNSSLRRWVIPIPKKRSFDDTSGIITAVLIDSNSQPLYDAPQAQLIIKPASLSESQLNEIIAEIGLLAISVGSFISRQSNVYVGEKTGKELGQVISPGGQFLSLSEAILDLYHSVRNIWIEIEKRPLRSLKQETVAVDMTKKINSSQVIISRTLNPSKKQVLSKSLVESVDCPENQFLCYVLDVYLHDIASSLINKIEEFERELPIVSDFLITKNQRDDIKILSFLEKAKERCDNRKSRLISDRNERSKLLKNLHQCAQWAKDIRNNSFLRKIVTPYVPNLSLQRLIKSPSYGLILEAHDKCNNGNFNKFSKVIRLYKETANLRVKRTWELYEIWCFVKLYSVFATQLRLNSPPNARNLFELIELNNGEMCIPKNQEFQLQGELSGKAQIKISFYYEPEEYFIPLKNPYRPDIKIKIRIDNQENIYYFDAKYSNYQDQFLKTFVRDVIGVAKEKYFDRFKPRASFVLHPDSRFDFWGEVPIEEFIQTHFPGQSSDVRTGYINHTYGGIALRPGISADFQIDRIIKLIFQYHDKFCTTCLNCGCEAETQTDWIPKFWTEQYLKERIINRIEDGKKAGGAIYCSCQQCGDFWVVQRCYGKHHRLLKFKHSFHKRSKKYQNSWMYVCPECGSDPDLLGQSKLVVSESKIDDEVPW